MSDTNIPIDSKKIVNDERMESWNPAIPAWRVLFTTELADLWVGGKALYLLLAFSILLGIQTFVLATNFELSLFTPQEMVRETIQSAIQVSLLIGLIIGADSISGERERATLEGLLLTPASRKQIVLGKFLAALSVWPAALVITIPFMVLLSRGGPVFGQAVVWGGMVGMLLIPAFTAVGMIVSYCCNSNKTSFFISLGIFMVFTLVGQVIGTTKIGLFGQLLQWLNPIPAGFEFLSQLLVSHGTFAEFWTSLASSIVFSLVMIGALFFYVSPSLKIEAENVNKLWAKLTRAAGLAVIAAFILSLGATPVFALPRAQSQGGDLQMTISLDHKTGKTGDSIPFETILTNTSAESSAPVIVAMNIINLSKEGDVVDPEDWSPHRTQYIDSLEANQSTTLSWTVNAVLDGSYMVYLVAIAQPEDEEGSGQVVASPGLHITITKYTSLNPSGVLPFAIGVPMGLVVIIFLLFRIRRRQIDAGESS